MDCIPMLFIWGCPTKITPDDGGAQPPRICPRCNNPSVIPAKSRTWFEFCFVPLVPFSSSHIWHCPICNWEVTQDQGPGPALAQPGGGMQYQQPGWQPPPQQGGWVQQPGYGGPPQSGYQNQQQGYGAPQGYPAQGGYPGQQAGYGAPQGGQQQQNYQGGQWGHQ